MRRYRAGLRQRVRRELAERERRNQRSRGLVGPLPGHLDRRAGLPADHREEKTLFAVALRGERKRPAGGLARAAATVSQERIFAGDPGKDPRRSCRASPMRVNVNPRHCITSRMRTPPPSAPSVSIVAVSRRASSHPSPRRTTRCARPPGSSRSLSWNRATGSAPATSSPIVEVIRVRDEAAWAEVAGVVDRAKRGCDGRRAGGAEPRTTCATAGSPESITASKAAVYGANARTTIAISRGATPCGDRRDRLVDRRLKLGGGALRVEAVDCGGRDIAIDSFDRASGPAMARARSMPNAPRGSFGSAGRRKMTSRPRSSARSRSTLTPIRSYAPWCRIIANPAPNSSARAAASRVKPASSIASPP